MRTRPSNLILLWTAAASAVLFLSLIGANGWLPVPLMTRPAAAESLPGEAVFKAQGCPGCHTVNGVGGKVGPDLTKVGERRERAWLEVQITSPKIHDEDSIMPSFATLPEKERAELLDYLQSLK